MSALPKLVGLNIDSPLNSPKLGNFLPSSWPPPPDFPVVIDASGKVVSRYGDPIWVLTPWAGMALKLNFGDGAPKGKAAPISPANADVFRQVVAWWLWGPNAVQKVRTLRQRHENLRPLFVLCSKEQIVATDLSRFPRVIERLAATVSSSSGTGVVSMLHDLWEQRDEIGMVLLDLSGIKTLSASLAKHEKAQTPYIPPRIWMYQVNRLREFLDDFLAHRQQIEDCYRFCLGAYAHNAGSLALACQGKIRHREPFKAAYADFSGTRTGSKFYGSFAQTARRFGIDSLIDRWTGPKGSSIFDPYASIQSLSSYFSLVGKVGTAYLLNLSMMRIDEGWSLLSDCLSVERDDVDEDIYILKGPTSKTSDDDDARWIASPSVVSAVEAMSTVSRLRMIAAEAHPRIPTTAEDLLNPRLVLRPYEPWSGNSGDIYQPLSVRPVPQSYGNVVGLNPKLFDEDQLRITQADLDAALLITPTLDPKRFSVGKVWPLAWHQLRRTGAVNMNASGVVGDASVQYQLKHTTRAMSRYYGQGYYHLRLRLNEKTRAEYIRAMYEVIAKEFSLLGSDRFISPYGDERKAQILRLVSEKDHKGLVASAMQGKLAYREHLLGGCANPAPCDKGGIDSVAPCAGNGNPCEHLMYDKRKIPSYRRLSRVIAVRLTEADSGSPLRESLEAQQRAVESALNACTDV